MVAAAARGLERRARGSPGGPPVVISNDRDDDGASLVWSGRERAVSGHAQAAAVGLEIRLDDLRGPAIIGLLEQHLAHMRALSPACSVHALDLERLRQPDITFWSVWDGTELVGCGALKQLDPTHGEIKSMRTAAAHLRKGVA